jgi:hypothetical protein
MILRWVVRIVAAYLLFCVVAGIFLAQITTHVRQRAPRNAAAFRAWVARDFDASVDDVSIQAADNVTLKAWYVQPPHGNGEAVILNCRPQYSHG